MEEMDIAGGACRMKGQLRARLYIKTGFRACESSGRTMLLPRLVL